MGMLLDGMKIRCKEMGITTLLLSESREGNAIDSKRFGFEEI